MVLHGPCLDRRRTQIEEHGYSNARGPIVVTNLRPSPLSRLRTLFRHRSHIRVERPTDSVMNREKNDTTGGVVLGRTFPYEEQSPSPVELN